MIMSFVPLFLISGFGTQLVPLALFVTVTGAAFGAGV